MSILKRLQYTWFNCAIQRPHTQNEIYTKIKLIATELSVQLQFYHVEEDCTNVNFEKTSIYMVQLHDPKTIHTQWDIHNTQVNRSRIDYRIEVLPLGESTKNVNFEKTSIHMAKLCDTQTSHTGWDFYNTEVNCSRIEHAIRDLLAGERRVVNLANNNC
jgi:hypothetical protein